MRILGVVSSSSREVPNAPTIGTATDVGTSRAFNNGAATVTFTAPTWTGGLPITGYTVTSSPGSFTATGAGSPLTVTGLASNTAYTFTARATNSVGQGAASAASNSITATTVPQAPTIGTATDLGTGSSVSVAFTPGATGGKTVTTYTATSSPGGFTGTSASSPITVSGLTAGTAYTFTVTATNANGTSTASAASNSVTPAVPTSFDSIASFTPTTATNITFSSIPQTYKHLQLRINALTNNISNIFVQVNGVSNYPRHILRNVQNNTTVTALGQTGTSGLVLIQNMGVGPTNPSVAVVDIHDYANTTTNKTLRMVCGRDNNDAFGEIDLQSSLLVSTSAITSLTVTCDQTWQSGSTISLYGIKG